MSETLHLDIAKYRIVRQLGKGAMGVVFEAVDTFLDRSVALKTVRKEFLEDAKYLERFKREAKAAARLSHAGIVAVHEYGEVGDTAYIAMEFVRGRELKAYLEAGHRFTAGQAAHVVAQVLDALGYAHQQGVVHRDIKPANLMVLADGQVKIADFGIARLEHSDLTQTGNVLGTPSYMSPEQFMGQTVDGRADLFATGVMLYELLTGERPFAGQSATTIMYRVLTEEPTPPSTLTMTLPPALDAVLAKALAKKPAERFQTAAEFRHALLAATAGDTFTALPVLQAMPVATAPQGPTFGGATQSHTPEAAESDPSWFKTLTRSGLEEPESLKLTPADRQAIPTEAAARGDRPANRVAVWVMVSLALLAVAVLAQAWYTLLAPAPISPEPLAETPVATAPVVQTLTTATTPDPTPALPTLIVPEAPIPVATAPATPSSTAPVVPNPASNTATASVAAPLPNNNNNNNTAVAAPPLPITGSTVAAPQPSQEPGRVTIVAVGYALPGTDVASASSAASRDSRAQLVTKALALYVEPEVLGGHYPVLQKALMQHPEHYIESVIAESAPQLGNDGLLHASIRAVLKVKAVQHDLNQLSEAERLDLIRAHGDPLIAVSVTASEEGGNLAGRSQLAENILKSRIQGFGYRTLTELPEGSRPDFMVEAEVRLKRLAARLPASGITVEKSALTSWTIRCINARTGEEILIDSELPAKRSWATADAAMQEVGTLIGDRFSAEFFARNSNFTGQALRLNVSGLPSPEYAAAMAQELRALTPVLELVEQAAAPGTASFDLIIAAQLGDLRTLLEGRILAPLQEKLGQSCLTIGSLSANVANLTLSPACANDQALQTLISLPPAELYVAPNSRRGQLLQGYTPPAGLRGPVINI